MNPINGTFYHRQMISKPNIVPLFNILFVLFFLLFTIPNIRLGCSRGPFYRLHHIRNGTHFSLKEYFIRLSLDEKSRVWLGSCRITDISNLPQMIEDEAEENKRIEPKVALRVHKDVEFGAVQRLLKLMGDIKIKKVTLMTRNCVSLAGVMRNRLKVWNDENE